MSFVSSHSLAAIKFLLDPDDLYEDDSEYTEEPYEEEDDYEDESDPFRDEQESEPYNEYDEYDEYGVDEYDGGYENAFGFDDLLEQEDDDY